MRLVSVMHTIHVSRQQQRALIPLSTLSFLALVSLPLGGLLLPAMGCTADVGSDAPHDANPRDLAGDRRDASDDAGVDALTDAPLDVTPSARVKIAGRHFVLNGQRWHPVGINYFPSGYNARSKAGGVSPHKWWEDKILVDTDKDGFPDTPFRDQVRAELDKLSGSLHYNTFIYGYNSNYCQPLIDILKEAEQRHLKVLINMSWTCDPYSDPHMPLSKRYTGATLAQYANPAVYSLRLHPDAIKRCRAAFEGCKDSTSGVPFYAHPAVLGYVLAWEPRLQEQKASASGHWQLSQGDRHELDAAFTAWVTASYGSQQAAINRWGFDPGKTAAGHLNTFSA
ncbi:MAG: hypothetical protein KAI47_15235, partial [Deltaproteobacteria bacterium]|nr:hypothetical protein [Deltaproteobacteria bacterium]